MTDGEMKLAVVELEEKISQLPRGYISKKNINGKIKYYLQWQENGKKKSKYIKDSEINNVETLILKRKEYEENLKSLKKLMKNTDENGKNYKFKTNVKLFETLENYVESVKNFKKRKCFNLLTDYLYGNYDGKVFILYGLRRTGKTTLIRQAIYEMNVEDKKKSVFIQITPKDDLARLNCDLKILESEGFKYIFIDEATLMEDFIEGAALLSDLYATCGMKIVLSGTDSLGFMLSETDELYDRCIMAHTTFIPYAEFESVLGCKGIDDYICYGGTMCISGTNYNENNAFASGANTDEYVDSAIAKNIQHSLKCYQYEGHFRHLENLYLNNELTSAINRVVEDINHRFTIDILTKNFKSSDLSISAKNLRKDKNNGNDILDRIDKEKVTEKLKFLLEIKNKSEQKIHIEDIHVLEIKEYLDMLDLTMEIKTETIPVSADKNFRTVFTQPGLRFAQAGSLVQSLLSDETFQDISIEDRDYILNRIISEIKGRMLEDIILIETKIAKKKKDVFKLQFGKGEFDMVVTDNDTLSCEVYEIKYSNQIVDEQYKNLIDADKCDKTAFRYGKITKKCVIYRGEDKILDNGIIYLNAENYLMDLYLV